ncbi:sterol transporter KNAG_0K01870 [Huiozyma naganishii CBS 8797]|uniref:Phosphatidylglycerol/phosphatidylinositol transfer protein n=1 Tax=Huiozyma naganishii (strain ATCC MYA-139 / BCRC 22969 / CBS 8797 / KCTC 17520 / NBRC 10181 / NCYC 3082 / Yp74L-3) TaxID=1071383 RepID=J7SAX7_HUIN7|nr:hypothetical protein KNAG_0K01870 [Kazachstania naganishii CBS 8797]CCK72551.1 hypothetical protein KNAG_0K01870 [Kazachstania naganishii CBS 8797]
MRLPPLLLLVYCCVAHGSLLFAGRDSGPHAVTDSVEIPGGSPLQLCDTASGPLGLTIESLELDPTPAKRAANLTITARGVLHVAVTQGSYVDVEVRLGLIRILTQRFDLCDVSRDNNIEGLQCPVSKGPHTLVHTVQVPAEVPAGRYSVFARAYSAAGTQLTCLTGDIVFQQRGPAVIDH